MVQATNGLLVPNVVEGKSTTCSVCGKQMKFEDTKKEEDQSLYGISTATHCDTRHIISSIGYRIEIAPIPEKGPYPPRGSERSKQIDKEKEERAKAARGEASTTTSTTSSTAASSTEARTSYVSEREKAEAAEKAQRDAELISEEAKDARTRKAAKGISNKLENQ